MFDSPAIGTIASSPRVRRLATIFGSVPSYDTPYMPTWPVDQFATTVLPFASFAVASRPSQRITDAIATDSSRVRIVGQPSEPAVPSESA